MNEMPEKIPPDLAQYVMSDNAQNFQSVVINSLTSIYRSLESISGRQNERMTKIESRQDQQEGEVRRVPTHEYMRESLESLEEKQERFLHNLSDDLMCQIKESEKRQSDQRKLDREEAQRNMAEMERRMTDVFTKALREIYTPDHDGQTPLDPQMARVYDRKEADKRNGRRGWLSETGKWAGLIVLGVTSLFGIVTFAEQLSSWMGSAG